jgi:hypothetical protein
MLGKWLQLFMVQRGVPHTNLHKQLTVPDGTAILFSAQWKRGKTKEIGMTRITRRDVLKLALAGGVATLLQGCGSRPSHGENPATVPRFEAALPIPPVLEPTRSDEHGDYYEIEARESTATILPGKRTTIRGYNGIFPGPNIVWSYLFAVVDEGAF